jgi:5-methylcytosine-specific restriction endonuclease McrA
VQQFTDVEIFERDGWRCHLCSRPVLKASRFNRDPMAASLDHIWPLSKGGEHVRENVACSHLGCNLAKNARIDFAQPLLVG